ncbi:MAG: DUF2164 family protein [Flavobacteriales bacterium]|nr:DUF2164 family protein [Flavobacteriales bacterium]
MAGTKRRWDRLAEEERSQAKQELIDFFAMERDEQIGLVAADALLDHFLRSVGGTLYNKGVVDARNSVDTRIQEMRYDLDDLLDLDPA